jgi:hypothetical protein
MKSVFSSGFREAGRWMMKKRNRLASSNLLKITHRDDAGQDFGGAWNAMGWRECAAIEPQVHFPPEVIPGFYVA